MAKPPSDPTRLPETDGGRHVDSEISAHFDEEEDKGKGKGRFNDRLRIKIWEVPGGAVLYDNQLEDGDDAVPVQEIDGGSIVFHGAKPY